MENLHFESLVVELYILVNIFATNSSSLQGPDHSRLPVNPKCFNFKKWDSRSNFCVSFVVYGVKDNTFRWALCQASRRRFMQQNMTNLRNGLNFLSAVSGEVF